MYNPKTKTKFLNLASFILFDFLSFSKRFSALTQKLKKVEIGKDKGRGKQLFSSTSHIEALFVSGGPNLSQHI